MRGQDGGDGVEEVGPRLVGEAEGAGGEGIGAELEVEEAGFEVDEAGAEDGVRLGKGAESGEAGEEDIDRYLEAGLGCAKDVFW